jgi:uracil-DNA glycosylase
MKTSLDNSWVKFLGNKYVESSLRDLETFLDNEYKNKNILPNKEDIFKAFSFFKPHETRVVILGQDPYHTPGYATGLAFSVPKGKKLPPSLKNIYKEIASDMGIEKDTNSGDLRHWAQQGVLLLNSVLTVQQGNPGSHRNKGWGDFTDTVIKKVSSENNNVVFMLWGNYAQKKNTLIDTSKHLVLDSAHPSPLSAYRGFFGNKHFSQANEYLKKSGRKEIEW